MRFAQPMVERHYLPQGHDALGFATMFIEVLAELGEPEDPRVARAMMVALGVDFDKEELEG